jgi:hypothetical protein
MRRVREGMPFRRAYREVAAELKAGRPIPEPGSRALLAARTSTGGAGNLSLGGLRRRMAVLHRWNVTMSRRFDSAMRRLAGVRGR